MNSSVNERRVRLLAVLFLLALRAEELDRRDHRSEEDEAGDDEHGEPLLAGEIALPPRAELG